MSIVNLKRLIGRKEFSSLLADTAAATGSAPCVKDALGNVLFGTPSEGGEIPVTVCGETVGFVCGKGDLSVIVSLVRYAANAENEKKTLAAETLGKYKEITMLYDFSERVAVCLNPNEVARLVAAEAMKVITADDVSVLLQSDDDPRILKTAASSSDGSSVLQTIDVTQGIPGSVFCSGRAEIVNDRFLDPRAVAGFCARSMMCAPLKIKDKVIGVIKVISNELFNYTAEDLKLLIALASQAAASIETAKLYDELQDTFFTMVQTLAETIEKRDPYTGGHTKRVMEYSLAIGEELGIGTEEMVRLRLAAILHDIGKIGVRDSVLMKESKLTDEEFNDIKKHTVYGDEILSHVQRMRGVIPGVRHHHEKYDGRGYPDGLKAEEIDITARIIGVADSFDAMTSNRPYRKGLSLDIAFSELRKYSGSQFDAGAVLAFFSAYEKGTIRL
jgi:putative nucleotidyltransferase with HDIG domain